jgi:hypothetical protein
MKLYLVKEMHGNEYIAHLGDTAELVTHYIV